ncbi:protein IWS1 homolog [Macrosteles quadrilineatus]|uniref:protein IWS1 homolog n=1 Tax=Macrosteles quadrilineatus TaxID=74068 RepID=UPI0023E0AA7E|nr:protein IWS1 homolog [Macrosteles quadrilineatus]
MARKQSKPAKTTKKDSSVGVNAKKGGKITKKVAESKTKKKVESQLKLTVKTQKRQTKPAASSPANSGRRSSRTNNDSTRNSLTSNAQRSSPNKKSTSKTKIPSRANNAQSTSKRKSNSTEQTKSKKQVVAKKANESPVKTSPAVKKKPVNETNGRGNKRSYAQSISSSNTEVNNEAKRRKTDDLKNITLTSRRNRNIKPTVKGSEWKKTILQKKAIGAKQEKPSIKVKKTTVKNKSPKQNKKSVSPKSITKSKAAGKTLAKSPKSQIGVKTPTEKKKAVSPPKKKVKSTVEKNTVSSKSPLVRNSSRKSSSKPKEDINSPKANTLATSIKNKFNSCISKKRSSSGAGIQENVLVAQGILDDILSSVGIPKDSSDLDKAVCSEDVNLITSKSQTTLLKMDKEETDPSSQTFITPVSECVNMDTEQEKKIMDGKTNDKICIETTTPADKPTDNENDLDENLEEEMELRLSDTSVTSVNENDTASSEQSPSISTNTGNEVKINSNSKCVNEVKSSLDSDNKVKLEVTQEHSDCQNKLTSQENDHNLDPLVDLKKSTSSSQLKNNTKGVLQEGIVVKDISHSSNKKVDLANAVIVDKTVDNVKEKSKDSSSKKREDIEPNEQSTNGNTDSAIKSNTIQEISTLKENQEGSLGLDCKKNTANDHIVAECKVIKESSAHQSLQDHDVTNGKYPNFDKIDENKIAKSSLSPSKVDSSCVIKPENKLSNTKPPSTQPLNGEHKTVDQSRDKIIPCDTSLKKPHEITTNGINKQKLKSSVNDPHLLQISEDKEEQKHLEIVQNEITKGCQSLASEKSDVIEVKEDSADTVSKRSLDSVEVVKVSSTTENVESQALEEKKQTLVSESVESKRENCSSTGITQEFDTILKVSNTSNIVESHALEVKSETSLSESVDSKLENGSSTGITQEFDTITIEEPTNSSDEHRSKEEQLNTEEPRENLKHEISTIVTESKDSSVSPIKTIACGKNNIENQLENCCPKEKPISTNVELPADNITNEEKNGGILKVEETCQEENAQNSIVGTNGETLNHSSDTLSNKMSVDEEYSSMEIECGGKERLTTAPSSMEVDVDLS